LEDPSFDAEAALTGYAEQFLLCRDLRHSWAVRGYYRKEGVVVRSLVCDRCGTERTDRWRASGERDRVVYRHPEGYELRGGRVHPIDVRRETLHRVAIYDSEADMLSDLLASRRRRNRRGRAS